ncbi:MAG TPA: MFS transporter [Streptosporangiaceae bacterium]|nr:MFS transporter [Streptosporangiaceae bacterium]
MGNERRTQKAPAGRRARLGRDFWFYFSGQAVSQLGGSFTTFALPLLVFKLTHSATNLALTTVAEFVPYLLFGLPLGAVVDRFDRKRLMLGSDIAQAFVIAVIPVLAIGGLLRVADIYAVTFVQSTLGIIFNCGEFAAIPSLVGEQELVTANARIMATNNAGQILGPGLAGALVAFVPVAGLLFVDAGSFLVSSGCLALIRCSFNAATPARRPAGSAIRALLADVREGLAYVWSNPVLRSISIMMALINLVAATADSQLVLFARRALHATNSEIGFLYAAGAAGIVAVSLVAGPIRQHVSFAVTALGALVLAGLTMTAMALAGSYAAALVLWAASSGFGMLLNINTVALRQAIVPPRLYGRVVSVAQVLAWSAIPLGSLAGAAAINLSGSVTGVYAVIGVLIAAIALAFAFSPVADGDRYLAEAAERRARSAGGGHSPASGATEREGAGHGPDAALWRTGVTLTGPDHGRDPGVDRDVAGGQPGRLPAEIEVEANSGPDHQAVRRAAEVEHAELVALFHVLSLVHGDLAGGDLGHADWKDAHEPDGRIVGFDEHHRPGGDLGDVALRVVGPGWVVSFGGSLGIVRAAVHVGFHDPAVDRAVPAVVAERAEECLVYRAAHELVGPGVVGQHVGDGVRLPLDPEPVVAAHVVA